MTSTVLVTGANGFLGSKVARKLSDDERVLVLGTYRSGRERLLTNPPESLRYVQCDLTDRGEVANLFQRNEISAVIHTAAVIRPSDTESFAVDAVRSNVLAQAILVAEALANGVSSYAYCSSISVYDGVGSSDREFREEQHVRPSSLYGWSKFAGEEVLRLQGADAPNFNGINLRLAGIHGPGRESGVVHALLSAALHGEPLVLNEPESSFRLLFVDDAVDALLRALDYRSSEGYANFNVAGAEGLTLNDLAERVLRVTNSESRVERNDQGRVRQQVMSTSLAGKRLGFEAQPTDTHLQSFAEFLRHMHTNVT